MTTSTAPGSTAPGSTAPGSAAPGSAAPGSAALSTTNDPVGVTTSTGGIRRLNPADGLFLRAEHLDQMQTYARELTLAVGIAGGSGVVYGYGLTLEGSELTVAPGLAVESGGMPLRTGEPVTISLEPLATPASRFWVVEVIAAGDRETDEEPVYGNLCGDPCSGSSIHPWKDNAVRIQVRPDDTLPGLASVPSANQLRNWLASAYFEQERRESSPWLTPDRSGGVAALADLPWSMPAPAAAPDATLGYPSANGVPIGALLRVDGAWVLDVWTARRDQIATQPRTGWEWRLGLRPWSVFVAQVLQFQAQLGAISGVTDLGEAVLGDAKDFYEMVHAEAPRSRKALEQAWKDWQEKHLKPLVAGSLIGHGINELPPAGFLPTPTGKGDMQEQLQAIFGPNVVIRLHHNSADAALRAVTGAQHLDRIPLDRPAHKPVVDLWMPDTAADLPAVFTPSYGWMAFARCRDEVTVAAPPATDQVDVYVVVAEDRMPVIVRQVAEGQLPKGDPVVTLEYPAAQWGIPTTEDAVAKIDRAVAEQLAKPNAELHGVIGVARSDARRPLAVARACLLPVAFDNDGEARLPSTYVVRRAGREAVLFVLNIPAEIN